MEAHWFSKTVSISGTILASVFSERQEVIFIDFLDNGKIITGNYCSKLLTTPREKSYGEIRRKVVQCCFAFSEQCRRDLAFKVLKCYAYSLNLANSDYQVKKSLNGRKFALNVEVIKALKVLFEKYGKF